MSEIRKNRIDQIDQKEVVVRPKQGVETNEQNKTAVDITNVTNETGKGANEMIESLEEEEGMMDLLEDVFQVKVKNTLESKENISQSVVKLALINESLSQSMLKLMVKRNPFFVLNEINTIAEVDKNAAQNALLAVADVSPISLFTSAEEWFYFDEEFSKNLLLSCDCSADVEQILDFFVSVDKEWAKKMVEKTADRNGLNLLSKIKELRSLDDEWAVPVIKAGVEKAGVSANHIPDELIDLDPEWLKGLVEQRVNKAIEDDQHFVFSINQNSFSQLLKIDKEWAKKIAEKYFSKLNMTGKVISVLTSVDEEWGVDLVKKSITHFDGEHDVNELIDVDQEWFKALVENSLKKYDKENNVFRIDFASFQKMSNLNPEWAQKIFLKSVEKDPQGTLYMLREFIDSGVDSDFMMQVCETARLNLSEDKFSEALHHVLRNKDGDLVAAMKNQFLYA